MFKNAIMISATAATLALGATGMARALDLPDYRAGADVAD